jgi:peptide-methionine (S)-S-oxide reductase
MNLRMPQPEQALPGRDEAMPVPETHFVNGHRITPPFPAGLEQAVFGMGCFWGAERKFWEAPGVYSTAVGYAGGYTPNPTYREVCSGMTGHTEVVLVVYDPKVASYDSLLKIFWKTTIRRRACDRATTSGRSTARPSIRSRPSRKRLPKHRARRFRIG